MIGIKCLQKKEKINNQSLEKPIKKEKENFERYSEEVNKEKLKDIYDIIKGIKQKRPKRGIPKKCS